MKNIIIVSFSILLVFISLVSGFTALTTQNWQSFFVNLFIIGLVVYGNIIYFKKQKKSKEGVVKDKEND